MSISVLDTYADHRARGRTWDAAAVPSGDQELFFAETPPKDVEHAKAMCLECPLRAKCLAGALERREPWGVWGGELFLQGVVIPRKRPRGRPRRTRWRPLSSRHQHQQAAPSSTSTAAVPLPQQAPTDPNHQQRRSKPENTMSYVIEHLARAEQTERLAEAQRLRRGHQLALARRKSRRAERRPPGTSGPRPARCDPGHPTGHSQQETETHHTMNTNQNRSNEMRLMNEDLARAQMSRRLGEAHDLRRGHQLAMSRRLSRRAERAAQQARLALARSL